MDEQNRQYEGLMQMVYSKSKELDQSDLNLSMAVSATAGRRRLSRQRTPLRGRAVGHVLPTLVEVENEYMDTGITGSIRLVLAIAKDPPIL